MKKIVFISLFFVGTFVGNSVNTQSEELMPDQWCFSTWTFVYNAALAQGATVGEALELAGAAFDTCIENQQ